MRFDSSCFPFLIKKNLSFYSKKLIINLRNYNMTMSIRLMMMVMMMLMMLMLVMNMRLIHCFTLMSIRNYYRSRILNWIQAWLIRMISLFHRWYFSIGITIIGLFNFSINITSINTFTININSITTTLSLSPANNSLYLRWLSLSIYNRR